MPKHAETRHLPYTREQMFDMVADVKRYPEFLPWVSAMRVRQDSETATLADMIVGFKGLREAFTSKVEKAWPDHIHVEYIDGPLKYLHNDWTFRSEPGGCAVDFAVDFQFKNRMFEMLAGQVFGVALRRMIGAFEDRAKVLYGSSSSNATSAA
jgi:coenzyme Q-binding protein COQ10